jgi:hypothetical protein
MVSFAERVPHKTPSKSFSHFDAGLTSPPRLWVKMILN